jgi:hypothetical protein
MVEASFVCSFSTEYHPAPLPSGSHSTPVCILATSAGRMNCYIIADFLCVSVLWVKYRDGGQYDDLRSDQSASTLST